LLGHCAQVGVQAHALGVAQLVVVLQVAHSLSQRLQPEQQVGGVVIAVEWGDATGKLGGFITQAHHGGEQAGQGLCATQPGIELLQQFVQLLASLAATQLHCGQCITGQLQVVMQA
jgi:hypothetical protein